VRGLEECVVYEVEECIVGETDECIAYDNGGSVLCVVWTSAWRAISRILYCAQGKRVY
jgi:hypothetical protein